MNSYIEVLNIFFNPIVWVTALGISLIVLLLETVRIKEQVGLIIDLNWLASGIKASTHQLTHKGGISQYFFNLDYLTTSPDDINKLVHWYTEAIQNFNNKTNVDCLIFIEKDSGPVGAITLMGSIISTVKIPGVIARLRKRESFAKIIGQPEIVNKLAKGLDSLIVTDAITTSRTVKDAIDAINEWGGNVIGICAILDRRSDVNEFIDNIPVIHGTTEWELSEKHLIEKYIDPSTK